ncbi:MAG: cysteine desulfurase [Cytophagaceae bacterium]|nr:cysteine desulfurase [Cytophagaceae bacterium]
MHVYLDNAATTPLDKQVLEAMLPYMQNHFGNPSSIHTHGREARSAIEKSRKTIASLLNTSPSEIFFTSGGTEADNTAIISGIRSLGIKHAITSPIEHHAVLHALEYLEKNGEIKITYVQLDEKGHIAEEAFEELVSKNPGSFVSIMHANNEVGNINNIEWIGNVCTEHQCIFHSDTVQTVGHFPIDLQKLKLHFIAGSAHKFHGPKGTGFLYMNHNSTVKPLLYGGAQERNMRGGTENVYGIVGLAKAMELAYQNLEKDKNHIRALKQSLIQKLKLAIPEIDFNGDCCNPEKSLYTVVNAALPQHDINEMLLFNLDIHKISVSAGSACASGTDIGSHVLQSLKADENKAHVRFSFSKYNTMEEADYVVEKLQRMYK